MRTIGILIVIGIVAIGFLVLKHIADKTAVPKNLVLTGSTNRWQTSDFVLPKGKNFNIVLGLPEGIAPAEGQYSGTAILLNSSNVIASIPFDAAHSTPASWLSEHKLAAYILTWPTNHPPIRLDDVMTAGTAYRLVVNFSNTLPDQGDLWLTYLQEWKDRQSQ
jgi:hypothetical protein